MTNSSCAKKLATAEYLLRIIKAIGITQSAFAKRIGVSQPNFTDMLKGRRSYPKHIVLRMEQEFGIPFKKFMAMAFKERVYDWYEQNKKTTKTMNKEDFVSYETAAKLKELGFDWECYEFWDTSISDEGTPIKIRKTTQEPRTCVMSERNSILESMGSELITAPTMAKAQKWLRIEKEAIIAVYTKIVDTPIEYSLGDEWYYSVWIGCDIYAASDTKDIYFDTYESALAAGITAALEILTDQAPVGA